jgi:hypothetical protein
MRQVGEWCTVLTHAPAHTAGYGHEGLGATGGGLNHAPAQWADDPQR